jgi:hypothetical protein
MLTLTADPGTNAALSRTHAAPKGRSVVSISRENGAPLEELELRVGCENRVHGLTIHELWLQPPREPRWPELVETLVEVDSTTIRPGKEHGVLTWDPPIPLVHDPGGDPAKLAQAILALPAIVEHLVLEPGKDVFEFARAQDHHVLMNRYHLWRGQRIPVEENPVSVTLLDGYRLSAVRRVISGPRLYRVNLPDRPALSEKALLAALARKKPDPQRVIEQGLHIVDDHLVYRTKSLCLSQTVDAFTAKVLTEHSCRVH